MKRWIIPLMLGFGVTLALVVGERMSTDAMSVVIGVAVGVAASVPASLLLVALLRRERRPWQNEAPPAPPPGPYQQLPQQPPVIVLSPNGMGQMQQYTPLPPPEYTTDGGLRRLRVIGADEEWSNEG